MTFDESLIEISFYYVKEYKKDSKNFLSTYKKFKSVRMIWESIVAAYKRSGAYKEMEQQEVSFKPYAYKYFDGKEAKLFSETLLIIYSLINYIPTNEKV